jgi:hypothetical protein
VRWPDKQLKTDRGCLEDPGRANDAARTFLETLSAQAGRKILVGLGNNFSPEFLARLMQVDSNAIPGRPEDRHKDRFIWDYSVDPSIWRADDDRDYLNNQALFDDVAEGNGRIPTDNVACFLSRAGYTAIVPGKQDFHFGAERLRQIARFLASRDDTSAFKPVQILAANLVIQTTIDNAAKRISFRDKQPPLPYSNDKGNLKPDIGDGEVVLPWLREIKILNVPQGSKVAICAVQDQLRNGKLVRDPDYMPNFSSSLSSCQELSQKAGAAGVYQVPKTSEPTNTFLTPNNDYWLCVNNVRHPLSPTDTRPFCEHFSVYSPFFIYPNLIPRPGGPWPVEGTTIGRGAGALPAKDHGYLDPRPYVLIEPTVGSTDSEVAIFGVVDPQLTEQVGQFNDNWLNERKNRTTKTLVIDPVLALKQLLQYFDDEYMEKHGNRFQGVKVLLAQMPTYNAERIGVLMKGQFNLIIAQAQREYSTPEESASLSVPSSVVVGEAAPRYSWVSPTFYAAPTPFYDGDSTTELKVRIASAEVKKRSQCVSNQPSCEELWTFRNNVTTASIPETQVKLFSVPQVASTVSTALSKTRIGIGAGGTAQDQLQQLTLELMQTATDSDIAILQKRDMFEPYVNPQFASLDLQQILDRVFWKDDFVVRILVRGDVLKSVMNQSKQFDAQDKLTLSLFQEQGRGLVTLGILSDPVTNQFFVHGDAVDPTKMYSVAVSDYVALGDTGYSDLLTPPVGHPLKASDFSNLWPISGLVCDQIRSTVPGFSDASCGAAPVFVTDYFDYLNQEPLDTTKGLTPGQHFLQWARFQQRRPSLYEGQTSLEKAVQQSALWSLSLSKLALGFSMNQHNNGSEANLASLFAGVPNTQVNAPDTNTTSIDFSSRVTRTSAPNSFFGQVDGTYTRQLTRQNNATNSDLEAQLNNMFAAESGILPRLYPRTKEIPDLKILLSERLETQLSAPISSFKINSTPPTTIQGKIDRTKSLLSKIGLRFDNEKSYIEAGYEIGELFTSPLAFTFNPDSPNAVTCTATGAKKQESLATCVKTNSTPPSGLILPTSSFRETTRSIFENGLFLNFKLSVPLPLNNNLSYVMESHGQYFFNHNGDVSVDTRFQEDWTQSLIVPLFGNLSFVPKFEMFFYENKVERNFFYAIQPSVTLQYGFDWHRGLPWWRSMMYQTPKAGAAASKTAK